VAAGRTVFSPGETIEPIALRSAWLGVATLVNAGLIGFAPLR
jgi:hypothetical protein